jgi:predicted dehydrogenase
MKTKAYRVAIIGCGHMGAAHMDHIYYKDNVSVTYACDLD